MKKEVRLGVRNNSSFEERLIFNRRISKLITRKQKESIKPIMSDNAIKIKFTEGGYTNLSRLKNSVVVKPNYRLIKTSKVITIVTSKGLKKAHKMVKKDNNLLNNGILIREIIWKKVNEYRKKLANLNDEYEKISTLVTKVYTKEMVDEVFKKMTSLKKQTNDLKKQCIFLVNLYDFDDISLLKNGNLTDLCSSFTEKSDATDVKLLVSSCKKDLDYTQRVLDLVEKTSYLDYELVKKSATIKKRDEDFKKEKGDVTILSKLQEEIMDKIDEEVEKTNEMINKIENFSGKETLLSLTELQEIANDYIDYILKTDLLVKIFRFLRSLLLSDKKVKKIDDRETLIKKIYNDYEDKLSTEINDLNRISDNLKKSLEQLTWLKKVFYEKFFQYKDLIKEYDEIYEKLEKLEQKLANNCEVVNVTQKKLNEQKIKVKAKKLS